MLVTGQQPFDFVYTALSCWLTGTLHAKFESYYVSTASSHGRAQSLAAAAAIGLQYVV